MATTVLLNSHNSEPMDARQKRADGADKLFDVFDKSLILKDVSSLTFGGASFALVVRLKRIK